MKGNFGILLAFAWVLLVLSGCAVYKIERCEDGICNKANIYSARKFKTVRLYYDGEARTFLLEAGDVELDSSIVKVLAGAATEVVD